MKNDILNGIRVVEMSTHVAGPYCARELSDLGAEVIKVETTAGEPYRVMNGAFFQLPHTPENDWLYNPYNTNKRHLSVNLKSDDGKEAFLKLLATADVFICNTREKGLEKMGLGFESLLERFPALICCGVSGFGNKGPDKDRPGFDATAFWSPNGALQEWSFKGEDTMIKPFYGFGDGITAAQMVIGILSALYSRKETGKGDIIRVSLLATGLWQNVCGMLRYQAGHQFPKKFTEPIVPLDNFYKTKDGKWIICSESWWGKNCGTYLKMFGTPELMDDPKWNSLEVYMDQRYYAEKVNYFKEHFAQLTSQEIADTLLPAGIVCGFLNETDDVLNNEQASANDCYGKMKTMAGDELTIANNPIRFANHPLTDEYEYAHMIGEDTEELLRELGYDSKTIARMIAEKAVRTYPQE